MKLIVAVIRPERLNDVLEALFRNDVRGITVTREIFESMVAEVTDRLSSFAAQNNGHDPQQIHLLGTSGTVTTIAGVHLGLRRYDRRRVDGCWMSDNEVSGVIEGGSGGDKLIRSKSLSLRTVKCTRSSWEMPGSPWPSRT